MKKLGIIGYGALGKILCEGIRTHLPEDYRITGILEQADALKEEIRAAGYRACDSFEELVDGPEETRPDMVIEIAGVPVVKLYSTEILKRGISLVIVSIGALADAALWAEIQRSAKEHHTKVYLPSGAVGGFDILRTIHEMGGAEAEILNLKAPRSLNGAPYLNGRILSEEQEENVFEGNALEAIAGFPKNVNVAVSSGLASVGVENMGVKIRSIPGLEDNIHAITCQNDSVKAEITITSKPDPVNPKSSIVTAWSVVAMLRNLASPVEFF